MVALKLCSSGQGFAGRSHGRRACVERAKPHALNSTLRTSSACAFASRPSFQLFPSPRILWQATSGCGGGGGGGPSAAWPSTAEDDDGSSPGRLPGVLLLALFMQLTSASPAHALFRKKKKKKQLTIDDYSDQVVTLFWPICQNLGFSGAIGLATAFALKTVGRSLAVIFGILFAIIQGLAYTGYISVNWTTVHKDVIKRLDVNQSGKFDASDVKSLTASALAVLSQGVPSTGGFCAGFLLGLK